MPLWPALLLRGLARYVMMTGAQLNVGDVFPAGQPITRWALAPAEGPFELVVDRACTLRRAAGAQRLDVDVEQGSLEILRMLVHGALPVARLDLRWLYAASDVSDELPEIADLLERIAPAELALERDMRAALPAKLAKQASLLP